METCMKALFGTVSLVVAASMFSFAQDNPASNGPRPLTFTHVGVIDATGSALQPDMTVVVTGNTISAIGKFGSVQIPANAVVTNATDRFMIPGMAEMHTHVFMRS